uniref:Uncharacterized protein n=1 Tax=Romanomermis culicivorax TaxID=13658 RepID=A0A915I2M7_ROMCU
MKSRRLAKSVKSFGNGAATFSISTCSNSNPSSVRHTSASSFEDIVDGSWIRKNFVHFEQKNIVQTMMIESQDTFSDLRTNRERTNTSKNKFTSRYTTLSGGNRLDANAFIT